MSSTQVRAYAGKAQEYADAAASELNAERYIAATSLAIHAAINAADAVCGARLGKRAAGEAHDQALALLRQAGDDGSTVEKQLRRLREEDARTQFASPFAEIVYLRSKSFPIMRCRARQQYVHALTRSHVHELIGFRPCYSDEGVLGRTSGHNGGREAICHALCDEADNARLAFSHCNRLPVFEGTVGGDG